MPLNGRRMSSYRGAWGVVALAWACGGTSSNPDGGNGAVSSAPLSGVVEGLPFSPVSAVGIADFGSDGGTRFITVYELSADCSNRFPIVPQGQPTLLMDVPWQTGAAYNFDFTHNSTFPWRDDAGTNVNDVSIDGRIEIISAPPDSGSMGTVRLRASFDANNHVEGQFSVWVCN